MAFGVVVLTRPVQAMNWLATQRILYLHFQNYVPINLDILNDRSSTEGITEQELIVHNNRLLFVDVGRLQRSQRQKWYQCFDGVRMILFVVSSIDFDQVIYEDRKTNRLVQSCNIFEEIVNNKTFAEVSIVLFLNKSDLLADKVKRISIRDTFPKFSGDPHDLKQVQHFQLSLFDERRKVRTTPFSHHFTTDDDMENINFVIQALKEASLHYSISMLMLGLPPLPERAGVSRTSI